MDLFGRGLLRRAGRLRLPLRRIRARDRARFFATWRRADVVGGAAVLVPGIRPRVHLRAATVPRRTATFWTLAPRRVDQCGALRDVRSGHDLPVAIPGSSTAPRESRRFHAGHRQHPELRDVPAGALVRVGLSDLAVGALRAFAGAYAPTDQVVRLRHRRHPNRASSEQLRFARTDHDLAALTGRASSADGSGHSRSEVSTLRHRPHHQPYPRLRLPYRDTGGRLFRRRNGDPGSLRHPHWPRAATPTRRRGLYATYRGVVHPTEASHPVVHRPPLLPKEVRCQEDPGSLLHQATRRNGP